MGLRGLLQGYLYLHRGICEQEGLEQGDFQIVVRGAGETETTQENTQDWLKLDEGDPMVSASCLFIVLKEMLYSDLFLFSHQHYQHY
jgi:hypothetical protein